MKVYPTEKIRNIALVSHSGAGKTTFVERLLFDAGVTTRMGSVTNGNAAMDFEPEEIDRQSSIATAIAAIEHKGHKVNVFDTPGYIDFLGDVSAALHVVEGAAVFVEAVAGVEVGTEIVWAEAQKRGLSRVLVVNKMDRENVRAERVMSSISENLLTDHQQAIRLQLPIGEGTSFKGVVDLATMKAYGKQGESLAIPSDLEDAAEEARMELVEAAAEGEEALMEKYFEEEDLSAEDILQGLKGVMQEGSFIPVLFCAGEAGIATQVAVDTLIGLTPNPSERTFSTKDGDERPVSDDGSLGAFIFKTREDVYGKTSYIRVFSGILKSDNRVWDATINSEARVGSLGAVRGKETLNVGQLHAGDIGAVVKLGNSQTNDTLTEKSNQYEIEPISPPNPIFSVAIHPVAQSDVSKLSEAMSRLKAEDPTYRSSYERATRQTILSGMGDVHLGIAVKKLASKFGVNVTTTTPRIPYRETITKKASAEYTHKKQTGGAGQYGRVFLRLESLGDDAEFEFGEEIFGGAISAPFVSATEKGCRQAIEAGPLAGYPVKGVKAIVYDGKEHPVDSKEIAFQIAGRECFRKAMLDAGPAMLEPVYNVTVTVPSDNMGDVMSDFNTRRARVQGMDQIGSKAIVKAEVPLAEMQRYLVDLRSMTQGRGVYSMEFAHYGRVPAHMQQKVIESSQNEDD